MTNFTAQSGVNWADAVEIIDAITNQRLTDIYPGAPDMLIELRVNDSCNSPVLTASTDDGDITIPEIGVVQWNFDKDRMSGLCRGTTYAVSCRATSVAGSFALFTGSLAYLDGEF